MLAVERESYVGLEQGVIGINAGGLQRVKVPPQLTYYKPARLPILPIIILLFYQIELLRIPEQWDNILNIQCSPYYSVISTGLGNL